MGPVAGSLNLCERLAARFFHGYARGYFEIVLSYHIRMNVCVRALQGDVPVDGFLAGDSVADWVGGAGSSA